MPGFIGKKLCPHLVIVKPNYDKYRAVSEQVRHILEQYDPDFCPMGLDESYLDLTSYVTVKMVAQDKTSEATPSKWVAGSHVTEGHVAMPHPHGHVTLPHPHGTDSGANLAPVPTDGSDPGVHPTPVAKCGNDSGASLTQLSTYWNDPGAPPTPLSTDSNSSGASLTPHHDTCDSDMEGTLTPPSIHLDLLIDTSGPPQLPRAFWECGQAVVREIRERVHLSTGLTASAGIATNKMLAKIASDKNKPNGQCFVEPTRDGILQFMWQLPIRKVRAPQSGNQLELATHPSPPLPFSSLFSPPLSFPSLLPPPSFLFPLSPPSLPPPSLFPPSSSPSIFPSLSLLLNQISGVGKVTEKTLASLGITTCKELYEKRGILPIAFSKVSCDFFFRVSLGIGSFSVNRYVSDISVLFI